MENEMKSYLHLDTIGLSYTYILLTILECTGSVFLLAQKNSYTFQG